MKVRGAGVMQSLKEIRRFEISAILGVGVAFFKRIL